MAAKLTQRERQLLTLLREGHSNKEIAYRLDLKPGSVDVYLCGLYKKLGMSRSQIVVQRSQRPSKAGHLWPMVIMTDERPSRRASAAMVRCVQPSGIDRVFSHVEKRAYGRICLPQTLWMDLAARI